MDNIGKKTYKAAKAVQNERQISQYFSADYKDLLQKISKYDLPEFLKDEAFIYSALRFGKEQTPSAKNKLLSDGVIAFITFCNWVWSARSMESFYRNYNKGDVKLTAKFLKASEDKAVAQKFSSGIHDYENSGKAHLFSDWIIGANLIGKWVSENEEKMQELRFKLFKQNIEEIKTALQSATLPFDTAVKRGAFSLEGISRQWRELLSYLAEKGDGEAVYELYYTYDYPSERWVNNMTRSAELGFAKAQRALGEFYFFKKKYDCAVKWLNLAVEGGDEKAAGILGKAYSKGNGVKKDLQKAAALLDKAAELGDADALYEIALAYESGKGREKDGKKAIEYFSAAAVLGNEQARQRLNQPESETNEYLLSKNYKKFLSREEEDPYAAYALRCYWENYDLKACESYEKLAVELFEKAAESGDAEAQYALGLCRLRGIGNDGEEDGKTALSLFKQAAEGGVVRAITEIGDMYKHGDGVGYNPKRGVKYFLKAAELGDADAMWSLGDAYCDGYGIEKDTEKGLEWFRKSAELGNKDAYGTLGVWLEEVGDSQGARDCWIKAVELNYKRGSQYHLAINLLKGEKAQKLLNGEAVRGYLQEDNDYYDTVFEAIKHKLRN